MEAVVTDTAIIMKQYNFSKPYTVEVIYEDDEETLEEEIVQVKEEPNSIERTQTQTSEQLKSIVENDLLNQVIENMSIIVDTYFKFSQVFHRLTTADAASFKLKYLDIKYTFFQKSLTVTTYLLLPQKSNEPFVNKIIMEVLKRGNLNSNMYRNVRLLYADLLAWTESLLGNKKEDAVQPNRVACHLNSEGNYVHGTNRYPSQEIVRENNISNEMLKNNSMMNYGSRFLSSKHTNNSTIAQDRTNCHLGMQTREQSINPLINNTAPSNIVFCLPNSLTYYNPKINYLIESNNSNHVINMQSTQNNISTHPFESHLVTGCQERVQRNVSQDTVHTELSMQEKNGTDISRSSVSRDSGFLSPDISRDATSINHQEFSTPWQNSSATNDAVIPNISINNSVLGSCHVCGRKTDLLCLGCFKYYYCSQACQNAHWRIHKLTCKKL